MANPSDEVLALIESLRTRGYVVRQLKSGWNVWTIHPRGIRVYVLFSDLAEPWYGLSKARLSALRSHDSWIRLLTKEPGVSVVVPWALLEPFEGDFSPDAGMQRKVHLEVDHRTQNLRIREVPMDVRSYIGFGKFIAYLEGK